MSLNGLFILILSASAFVISGCGNTFSGGSSSNAAASPEPQYYGKPTAIDPAVAVRVTMAAKFLYRQTDFTPGSPTNGLGAVVSTANAIPIPFAEFHIYDSNNNRIQQGETTTTGIADFYIPKTAGTYSLKVFSRAYNDYLKISVLEDIYANTPYSITKTFTIADADITAGTKDLTASPVYAEASEANSPKIEGGAFNIYFDILVANEYIRRNIQKNNNGTGVPTTDTTKWWVADKVTVYWKAGFNPYTYYGSSSSPLSFYVPTERKLYILGGSNGDVAASDTDHFDDSIIIHEYGHFLEDAYGHTESPGGSHTGDFIIDARLAWSEGWANYLQSAVLTGAEAHDANATEDRLPSLKRFQYYVDTYGYKGSSNAGVAIALNLAASGDNISEPDNVASDVAGTGVFREVSVARTLYKSTRNTSSAYDLNRYGGGVSFANIWKVFAGEDTSGANRDNPLPYSIRKTSTFPIPNSGLVNWLLSKNGVAGTQWDAIITEEKQNKGTADYAYMLSASTCAGTTLGPGALETGYTMYAGDVNHSNQQKNNDFYLYYHDGTDTTLSMSYTTSGNAPDLDLILYYKTYVYFEDDYWNAGNSSNYVAKSSRNVGTTTEQVSLSGLPAGFYVLNVKINAYGKTAAQMNGSSVYKLYKNGSQLCGTEQP
ncbi:MAG: hypothetical protein ACXVCP_06470 [Bdellovibrio sp.]